MKNTKKIIFIIIMQIIIFGIFLINISNATENENTINILLSDNEIKVNDNNISQQTTENIYLTNLMNNGGKSSDAEKANIEISNIININSSGTYNFTGNLTDGQISVNTKNINGDVIIVLNNVNITCKNAPAIFVYNTDTKSTNCNVIIKTEKDSTNIISGGKIKQSVEGWEDQSDIIYYVEKGYNDEKEYYERYKYDGAISSDISLTFEGEGTLTVNALSKEGIETKRNITINSGNYIINSLDDGINACADNESIITINGGNILVNVTEEAEEGDGIDSNGSIYINNGTVYAFASETSQDSGLDSDSGIYINGGIVVGTGNMADEVSSESEQEFIQLQFKNKVEADNLITITKDDQTPLIALKIDRAYSVLTVSSPDFTDEYLVYEGGTIKGTNANGVYTQITSYIIGTEKEYNTTANMGKNGEMRQDIMNIKNDNIYCYILVILAIILIILTVIALNLKRKAKFSMKGKGLVLLIGILIGAIIATAGFWVYNNFLITNPNVRGEQQMQKDDGMFGGEGMEKIDGEIPEKPDGDMQEMPNNGGKMTKQNKANENNI